MASAVLDRFLRYVSFDTASDPTSDAAPSSAKQLKLAEALVSELSALGVADARLGKGGVVYASIPATAGCEDNPALGLSAHMDTAPDASGKDVKPRVLYFNGKDVVLNEEKGIVFPVATFPEILKYKGEEIIFTDGTTLLGADDKAGIASIMTMVEYLVQHPETPHAKIFIAFTPDEEIGRGTENLDYEAFAAQYAYTIDGGEIGGLESETFNAATAVLTVKGVGVHTGSAKNKMVNALRCCAKFVASLPDDMTPEHTEGCEGFLHAHRMEGDVVESRVTMLIRDHDKVKFEAKKAFLQTHAQDLKAANPGAVITLDITDTYENMRPYLERAPKVLEVAREAYRAVGLTPVEEPIRGGTDGAVMSAHGLPCPNVFTGGLNYHGIFEYLPVNSLEKAAEVTLEIAKRSAEVKSLS